MRPYEVMVIYDADLDDADLKAAVDRATKLLQSNGAELGPIDHWGKRRLAYRLKRRWEGYYVVIQTRAEHSSEVTVADPATKKSTTYPGGEPAGFIIQFENGFKLYHMGDTGLFGDMRLIADYYKPDLIMIPIGGHFVMDPVDAAYATREMLKPKFAIPIHYGTFPVLRGTPQEYQTALGTTSTQVFPISPGDKLTF